MPLPNKSIVNSLLSAAAGSLLATQSAYAAPTNYNENTDIVGGDFSASLTLANDLPEAQQISGNMDDFSDADFFKTTLAAGTFSLAITYNNSGFTSASITARNDSGTDIGNMVFTSFIDSATEIGTITGTVPDNGVLVVDIQQQAEGTGGSYSMNLSAVPEPATATVTLLGAAAVALAVRSRKKSS